MLYEGQARRALNPVEDEAQMRNSRFKAMSVTDAAAERVKEIVAAADKPIVGVRVGVKNGGCAGMSYTMEFAEAAAANDEVVEDKGVKLLIDPKALMFLLGVADGLQGRQAGGELRLQEPQRNLGLRLRRERGDHAGFARGARRRGVSGRRGSPLRIGLVDVEGLDLALDMGERGGRRRRAPA